jgi:hypothetical protein
MSVNSWVFPQPDDDRNNSVFGETTVLLLECQWLLLMGVVGGNVAVMHVAECPDSCGMGARVEALKFEACDTLWSTL